MLVEKLDPVQGRWQITKSGIGYVMCMSVCLSVLVEKRVPTGRIFIFVYLSKMCQEIQVVLKSDSSTRYFT
jgi:hypothetical protein